jgi:5-methyltetrahydrofolate--homocysteine methyltransferase
MKGTMNMLLDEIKKAVREGEEDKTKELVEQALAQNLQPRDVLEQAMMPAMQEIGEMFSRNEAFISELLCAAEAMNEGIAILKPHFTGAIRNKGRIILGTVEGDIHTIGKNLVKICLESAGYEVLDIGENIKAQDFVKAYIKEKPDILGMSALLSSTAIFMESVIREVRAADPSARIIVGGAPITQAFADKIGASGYAPNAFDSIQLVNTLLK